MHFDLNFLYAGIVSIGALAGAVGFFKANVSKATIDLYKEDNVALRARLETLEADIKACQDENRALKSAHAYLQSVVTQADAIRDLREIVGRIAIKVGA